MYDVSDKTDPEFLGLYQISGTVRDVFGTEDYVYSVNGFGLVVEPAIIFRNVVE